MAVESFFLAVLLTITGGFLDAYTFCCRDQVFANAQTGNVVRVGIATALAILGTSSAILSPSLLLPRVSFWPWPCGTGPPPDRNPFGGSGYSILRSLWRRQSESSPRGRSRISYPTCWYPSYALFRQRASARWLAGPLPPPCVPETCAAVLSASTRPSGKETGALRPPQGGILH